MFVLDDLLASPGKAMLFLFKELARKAQEDFLDDESVKQELQQIYALLDAGKISGQEFESREGPLIARLEQIANLKSPDRRALAPAPDPAPPVAAASQPVIDVATVSDDRVVQEAKRDRENLERVLQWREEKQATPKAITLDRQPTPVVGTLTMSQVIDCTFRGLALLKLKVSTVTSVTRDENGWRVTAELVERRSVPDTSDLLGVYELRLDEAGNILRYERTRMRRRSDLGRS